MYIVIIIVTVSAKTPHVSMLILAYFSKFESHNFVIIQHNVTEVCTLMAK